MAENGGSKSAAGVPLTVGLTILGMIIGGLTGFYGARDKAIADCRAEIQTGMAQIRLERQETLSHYVSREDWAIWKESNRARADAQFYEIMTAIQRVGVRVAK